jgi:hypothetical protein
MSQLKQYTVNSIRSFDDLKYVASLFAQAQTFGKDSPQVLAVKIMAGLAFNLDPFSAATSLHVIQGKVVMSAGLQARLIKQHPKYDYVVKEITNEKCEIAFYNEDKECGLSVFTMEDAILAKLNGKDNWKYYPKNMLFARAISNGIRWFCPDALGQSVYSAEELELPTKIVNGDVVYDDSKVKTVAHISEGLPFDCEETALEWAKDYLSCTLKEAKDLFDSTKEDVNGKKALNFYLRVCEIKRGE